MVAGPESGDAGGYTPLYRAALDGDQATAARLLAQGADPNWHNDDNRWTALMVAVAEGHDAVATTLLADPRLDVNARDDRGRTALHLTAERGDAGLAPRLAQAANVNAKDDDGVTPLMRAAFAGAAEVVAALLNRPEIEPSRVDRDRRTALHWAVMGGDAAVVRLLVEDPRTNPAITDRPDRSAARDFAAVAGRDDLLALLDERPADGLADELPPGEAWSPRPPERRRRSARARSDRSRRAARGPDERAQRSAGRGRACRRASSRSRALRRCVGRDRVRGRRRAVLALQRSAGNRAVGRLLRATRAGSRPRSALSSGLAGRVLQRRRLPGGSDIKDLLSDPGVGGAPRAAAADSAATNAGLQRLWELVWEQLTPTEDQDVRAQFWYGMTRAQFDALPAPAKATKDQQAKNTIAALPRWEKEARWADALQKVKPGLMLGDPKLINTGPRAGTNDAANITTLVTNANLVFDKIAAWDGRRRDRQGVRRGQPRRGPSGSTRTRAPR